MIRIEFDPVKIPGSLDLVGGDLVDLSSFATKLQAGAEPLSAYLQTNFSQDLQTKLQQYDGSPAAAESLRDTLIAELNTVLGTPGLFEKSRFKTVVLALLTSRLAKLALAGDDLRCFNRLLLSEAYPEELVRSPKAEWHGWIRLAREATTDVIRQWEDWKPAWDAWVSLKQGAEPVFDPRFDDDVWKGFRDWLLENIFHNKCAYCETKIEGFIGDAEHFRPKGRVRLVNEDETTAIVQIHDENDNPITHPGYFWLAYHWQNLLPSCHLCNRYGGKKDLFPVEKVYVGVKRLSMDEISALIEKITESFKFPNIYYLEPSDLDVLENRLLLHPYYDHPNEHIYFKSSGEAAAWHTSKKGLMSIKVYDLNRKGKIDARHDAQEEGRKDYSIMLGVTPDNDSDLKAAAQKFKDEYYKGKRPYGAAVLDYIHDRFENSDYDPDRLLGPRH